MFLLHAAPFTVQGNPKFFEFTTEGQRFRASQRLTWSDCNFFLTTMMEVKVTGAST
jgi:hypothetical protein